MSTLQQFLETKSKKSPIYWIKWLWKEFWLNFKDKPVQKLNLKPKIARSVYPEGYSPNMTENEVFKHLNKEYEGLIMKRFKD